MSAIVWREKVVESELATFLFSDGSLAEAIDLDEICVKCLLKPTIVSGLLGTRIDEREWRSTDDLPKTTMTLQSFLDAIGAVADQFHHNSINTVHCVFMIASSFPDVSELVFDVAAKICQSHRYDLIQRYMNHPKNNARVKSRTEIAQKLLDSVNPFPEPMDLLTMYLRSGYYPYSERERERFRSDRESGTAHYLVYAAFAAHAIAEADQLLKEGRKG